MKYEKEIQYLNYALALDPNNVEIYKKRGIYHLILEDLEKGIKDLLKVVDLCPKHLEIYTVYIYLASAYIPLDKADESLKYSNKAIKINPNEAVGYNLRCGAYCVMGNINKAIAELDKVIKLEPQKTLTYCNRGHLYEDMGQFDKALEDYERAIKIDFDYLDAYLKKASLHIDLKDYYQAIKD